MVSIILYVGLGLEDTWGFDFTSGSFIKIFHNDILLFSGLIIMFFFGWIVQQFMILLILIALFELISRSRVI